MGCMVVKTSRGFVYKNRGSWMAAFDWKDEKGVTHRLQKSTGVRCEPDEIDEQTGEMVENNKGRVSATKFLNTWKEEEVARIQAKGTSCKTSFSDYAYQIIMDKQGIRKDSTVSDYLKMLTCLRENAELANTPMCELTPKTFRAEERRLLDKGLSTTTVHKMHVFYKHVCKLAVLDGDLVQNPLERVEAPRVAQKPINALDHEGVAHLNEALGEYEGDAFGCAVRLALMSGMRRGEVCALRWRDVDMRRRVIHVRYALSESRAGGHELSTPKTVSSTRDIPFGETLHGYLERRMEVMEDECQEAGLYWSGGLYVIGAAAGTYFNPISLGDQWHHFARFMDIRGTQGDYLRFHDLRHTFATIAINSGVDVKTVSVILGHSNAAMTLNIYADALEDSKRAGMETLDKILS